MTNGKRLLIVGVILALAIGIVGVAQAAEATTAKKGLPGKLAIQRILKMARNEAAKKEGLGADAMAQRIADMSGLPKETILAYKADGLTWPEIMDKAGLTFTKVAQYRAAHRDAAIAQWLTKLTDKSADELLAMKAAGKSWPQIIKGLGITPAKLKERAAGK